MVIRSQPFLISVISFAVMNGIIHSRTTSPATKIGVTIDGVLYSLILFASVFIILVPFFCVKRAIPFMRTTRFKIHIIIVF